ncbi:hypothetical protein EJ02DRAFT_394123 [Clathrospora elynae]|uniref:Uncharacterized protein n=1 Tax=Clathrospora elynae TaxID=706981 RepID=A0A6A5T6S3_9PLEO|nr:hypothetical protein EJ02DRAFT_394123 [Clathrospora elynae]
MGFFSNIRNLLPSRASLFGLPERTGPFTPTYDDVRHARALLKALKLPTELVLEILEYAKYWPAQKFKYRPNHPIVTSALGGNPSAATICLEANIFSNPTLDEIRQGRERPKIRSLEFDFVSHDQGWTSENTQGTYSTSSWLELSILRPVSNTNSHLPKPRLVNRWDGSPLDFHTNMSARGWSLVKRPESALQGPQEGEGDFAWYLQGNRVAVGSKKYHVKWSEQGCEGNEGAGKGEGFLQALQDGDRILVWARAKWHGWQCIVESVNVTVRYGV